MKVRPFKLNLKKKYEIIFFLFNALEKSVYGQEHFKNVSNNLPCITPYLTSQMF